MEFPVIDGHFWVERDGKVIDPHFTYYDKVCEVRNCDPQEPKSYLPAPEITQTLMKGIYLKVLKNNFGDKSQEELFAEVRNITRLCMDLNPRPNCCFQNCVIEIAERGGTLVFGSMGFKYKNKNGYFYEYGGENYTTIRQFVK